MTLFSLLEFTGVAENARRAEDGLKSEPDPYAPRQITVAPPTGEPYPHHEDHPESAGLDQGQLTSRLSETTPLIDLFLNRRRTTK